MLIEQITQALTAVRQQKPLVVNITNYVVMNTTANALLAVGASLFFYGLLTLLERAAYARFST